MKKNFSLGFLLVFASALSLSAAAMATDDGAPSGPSSSEAPQKSPNRLDAKSYLGLNTDVQQAAQEYKLKEKKFAKDHFSRHGKDEGRPYLTKEELSRLPTDFDPALYLKLHPDIEVEANKNIADPLTFAKYHFLKYGRSEGRSYKEVESPSVPTRGGSSSEVDTPPNKTTNPVAAPGLQSSSAPLTEGQETKQVTPEPGPLTLPAPSEAGQGDKEAPSTQGPTQTPGQEPLPETTSASPSLPGDLEPGASPEGPEGAAPSNDAKKPLTFMTKERPKPVGKRIPTRRANNPPGPAIKDPFEAAGPEVVPSETSGETETSEDSKDVGGKSDTPNPNAVPPKAGPPPKGGMGYGVSLGALTARKTESPQDKMKFVREKMPLLDTLDAKTKREVEGRIATLLRDVLKPGDADYQEFSKYQTQLRAPSEDMSKSLPPSGFGFLKKTPSTAKPAGSASSSSSAPTRTVSPKDSPESAFKRLNDLLGRVQGGIASKAYLNEKRTPIQADLRKVKEAFAADPKAMEMVAKVEKAMQEAESEQNPSGPFVKSSFVPGSTDEDSFLTSAAALTVEGPAVPVGRVTGLHEDISASSIS
ncbi:MAG: hypothetical protein ACK5TR_02265 [Alphaproteobacteria bacterium]|nr:hypothetical protein [Alphaproteobacteria bacterium]